MDTRLRVAVVTRYFPSSAEPWQGRSAYQTLRALSPMADVQVFYPNAEYPRFLRPRTRMYGHLDSSFTPADVRVSYHDYPALPLVSRPLNGHFAMRALLPHVRAYHPDLILGIFVYPEGDAALRIGEALKLPVAVMGIGSDIHSIGDPFSRRLTRKVLASADLLLCVSEDLRRQALGMGAQPTRAHTLPNGCDLNVFHVRDRREARIRLRLDPEAEVVLYVGRLDARKGLHELVQAAQALHLTRPRLQVCMVGEGPDKQPILDAVKAAGAGAFVHVFPPCAPDDVAVWMAAADLVTLPSYMEGCPNVVVEALACGRPVVASEVGGIPEILNNNFGRLIPARDPVALASALAAVLEEEWDPHMISAQRSRSWSAVAEELLVLLSSIQTTQKAGGNVA